jgi:hypothetical protein
VDVAVHASHQVTAEYMVHTRADSTALLYGTSMDDVVTSGYAEFVGAVSHLPAVVI